MSAVHTILYGKLAEQIVNEGLRAEGLFGDQLEIGNLGWLAVLAEEFGEVASHVTKTCIPPITHPEFTDNMLREELIQVAATAMRWVYALDSRWVYALGRQDVTPIPSFDEIMAETDPNTVPCPACGQPLAIRPEPYRACPHCGTSFILNDEVTVREG